jgi:hypothetical protein
MHVKTPHPNPPPPPPPPPPGPPPTPPAPPTLDASKNPTSKPPAPTPPPAPGAAQIAGLPTMIFISTDDSKPALRSEGLMTADTIKNILKKDLLVQ